MGAKSASRPCPLPGSYMSAAERQPQPQGQSGAGRWAGRAGTGGRCRRGTDCKAPEGMEGWGEQPGGAARPRTRGVQSRHPVLAVVPHHAVNHGPCGKGDGSSRVISSRHCPSPPRKNNQGKNHCAWCYGSCRLTQVFVLLVQLSQQFHPGFQLLPLFLQLVRQPRNAPGMLLPKLGCCCHSVGHRSALLLSPPLLALALRQGGRGASE